MKKEKQSAPNLKITSWYVNKHRTLEAIGIQNLPHGFIGQLKSIENHPLAQNFLISMLSPVLVEWLRSAKIPTLEQLLLTGTLEKGSVFTYDGRLYSKGLNSRKPTGDALLYLKLDDFGDKRRLIIKFHTDGLTTSSAFGALQRQPSVFVAAYVDSIDANEISCRPYIIGDLVQEIAGGRMDFPYLRIVEMQPSKFDAFGEVDFRQRIATSELEALRHVPEEQVKSAFAKILGVSEVPKDWGGETCDLYGPDIAVEGELVSCAFAFKGPSKFKKMELSDCGKNGDQIPRLFETPADVLVLQHCHAISPPVRKTMLAYARSDLNHKRRCCIIDGYETLKILRHFGYVKK